MIYKSEKNEYKIIKKLGERATGSTYLVTSKENKNYVLKKLDIANTKDWKTIERFKSEIKNLSSLNHENIPDYVDFIENEHELSYIQEYIEGETLDELIKKEVSVTPERLEAYIKQGLEILKYIHNLEKPLIHRDISPKNIIVNENKLYLIDLGVSLIYSNENTVTTAGTFAYMAPEQIMGRPTPQSDIYSLGITFIALINQTSADNLPLLETGEIDIKTSVSHIPEHLGILLQSMTQKGMENRLENADKGIKYLNNEIKTLKFEKNTSNMSPKKKIFNKKFFFIYLPLIIVLITGILRYNYLTSTNARRIKVFGSITKGHPQTLGIIEKIFIDDYTSSPLTTSVTINFLTTIQNDKYLLSIGNKKIILWNFKLGEIIWSVNNYDIKSYYITDNISVFLSNSYNFMLFSINPKTNYKLDLKTGKTRKIEKDLISKYISENKIIKIKDNSVKAPKKNTYMSYSNPLRNEIIYAGKNFIYLYNKTTKKLICKFSYISHYYTGNDIILSPVKNGYFALNSSYRNHPYKIIVYNNKCKTVDTFTDNSFRSHPYINFTNDGQSIIAGQSGGLISVWKIKSN